MLKELSEKEGLSKDDIIAEIQKYEIEESVKNSINISKENIYRTEEKGESVDISSLLIFFLRSTFIISRAISRIGL